MSCCTYFWNRPSYANRVDDPSRFLTVRGGGKRPDSAALQLRSGSVALIFRPIAKTFKVECHERTVGELLRRLKISHASIRPVHSEVDAEAREALKKG